MKSGENPDRDFIEQITQRQSDKNQIEKLHRCECEQPKRYNRSFTSRVNVKVVEQAPHKCTENRDITNSI